MVNDTRPIVGAQVTLVCLGFVGSTRTATPTATGRHDLPGRQCHRWCRERLLRQTALASPPRLHTWHDHGTPHTTEQAVLTTRAAREHFTQRTATSTATRRQCRHHMPACTPHPPWSLPRSRRRSTAGYSVRMTFNMDLAAMTTPVSRNLRYCTKSWKHKHNPHHDTAPSFAQPHSGISPFAFSATCVPCSHNGDHTCLPTWRVWCLRVDGWMCV